MRDLTFNDILAAKERRAALREELRQAYDLPVVSIAANIPGLVKNDAEIRALLHRGVELYRAALELHGLSVAEERLFYPLTGPFALLAVDGLPIQLKQFGIAIETQHEYARLYDIDVFDAMGEQISRYSQGGPQRTCFLCGNDAVHCMREKKHSLAELTQEVSRRFAGFAADSTNVWPAAVWHIGSWAIEAMLMEAACTPAPGLVDRDNAGAHRDMDFFTFLMSSSALAQTMFRCAAAGLNHCGSPETVLPVLRQIGVQGEANMFRVTGGVNTQKGLVFLLGIMTTAASMSLRLNDEAGLFEQVAAICQGLVDRELGILSDGPEPTRLTAGERLFLQHGITGIRGEMENGLPSVQTEGLPALRFALQNRLSLNDSLVHSLLSLMAVVEDSTVINRHGIEGLLYVQGEAKRILGCGGMLTDEGRKQILRLDETFIAKNISPGGAADLLAATYFAHLFYTRQRD